MHNHKTRLGNYFMEMKCSECGSVVDENKGSYRYTESGLDNVYLANIPVCKCSCGASVPSIFRLSRLHELIALNLVEKISLLNGNEIRFLRKNLRVPSKIFAKMLGVGKTTLSKWENDTQNHSEGYDRLIRNVFMIAKGIGRSEQQRIEKYLRNLSLRKSNSEYIMIAEKVNNDYVIRYLPVIESYSPRSYMIETDKQWSSASLTSLFEVELNPSSVADYNQAPPLIMEDGFHFLLEGHNIYGTQTA